MQWTPGSMLEGGVCAPSCRMVSPWQLAATYQWQGLTMWHLCKKTHGHALALKLQCLDHMLCSLLRTVLLTADGVWKPAHAPACQHT